jgi:hypothetical protein
VNFYISYLYRRKSASSYAYSVEDNLVVHNIDWRLGDAYLICICLCLFCWGQS